MLGIYSFGFDVDLALGVPSLQAPWFFRAFLLCFILFSRDEEADFKSLEHTGAGFGLVVDASDLRRALEASIRGLNVKAKSVRRYKATMFRMSESLAVSYRWQAE
eukprot:scaffold537096_cov20-Prasinocladus_malaysianus.AAC.1